MKTLKKMLVGVALVSATFSAQATTYNLNAVSTGVNYLSGYDDKSISVKKGFFKDIFNFSLTSSSFFGADVGILNLGKIKKIAPNFGFTLYSGTTLL